MRSNTCAVATFVGCSLIVISAINLTPPLPTPVADEVLARLVGGQAGCQCINANQSCNTAQCVPNADNSGCTQCTKGQPYPICLQCPQGVQGLTCQNKYTSPGPTCGNLMTGPIDKTTNPPTCPNGCTVGAGACTNIPTVATGQDCPS